MIFSPQPALFFILIWFCLLTDFFFLFSFFLFPPANPILALQTPWTQHQLQLWNLWKLQLQGTQSIPETLCSMWSISGRCLLLSKFHFCIVDVIKCDLCNWFVVLCRNGGTLMVCAALESPTRLTSPMLHRLRTPSPVRISNYELCWMVVFCKEAHHKQNCSLI